VGKELENTMLLLIELNYIDTRLAKLIDTSSICPALGREFVSDQSKLGEFAPIALLIEHQ
jgi:hypothetical protein